MAKKKKRTIKVNVRPEGVFYVERVGTEDHITLRIELQGYVGKIVIPFLADPRGERMLVNLAQSFTEEIR